MVKIQDRLTNQQFVLNKKLEISAEKNAIYSGAKRYIFIGAEMSRYIQITETLYKNITFHRLVHWRTASFDEYLFPVDELSWPTDDERTSICRYGRENVNPPVKYRPQQRSRNPTSLHRTGPWFNIKMTSYQYRKSHCGDKTVVRSSYLHNGISYTS